MQWIFILLRINLAVRQFWSSAVAKIDCENSRFVRAIRFEKAKTQFRQLILQVSHVELKKKLLEMEI